MFSEAIAKEIVGNLAMIADGVLCGIEYELQDGYEILYISSRLRIEPNDKLLSTITYEVRRIFEEYEIVSDELAPWMVNIYFGTLLVETVTPD